MLEEKNSLPGPEVHLSIDNRHRLAGAREGHANVRRHVIATFRLVREVICILWHQAIEKFFKITARGRIGVFHDDEAATGVLNKRRHGSRTHASFVDDRPDIVRDFVGPLAIGANFEFLLSNVHKICAAKNNIDPRNSRALILRRAVAY
jgi:hypothetical protein